MAQSFDVLAWLDGLYSTLPGTNTITNEKWPEAQKARAAVAELIEAATAVERLATRHNGDDRMFDRLHAALASFSEAR
jgi:hypothetical protein